MPRHEFGILPAVPKPGQRFDTYEPEKYFCISVEDERLEPLLEELAELDFYWHTLDTPGKGLAYCGTTLIPPASLSPLLAVLQDRTGFDELRRLLMRAEEKEAFVIHFGI